MVDELTERQAEILHFIQSEITSSERPPSMREIAAHFDLSSTNGVSQHLDALEKKGFIRRHRKISRGIEITGGSSSSIPVAGTIAAGSPIEAVEDTEEIDVNEIFLHKGCYLLRVKGNSMIEDCIRDGDFVIVEKRSNPDNGDIVVAIIDDNEATLKRFYRENGRIKLQPANSSMNPIYPESIEIRGIVSGILRKY